MVDPTPDPTPNAVPYDDSFGEQVHRQQNSVTTLRSIIDKGKAETAFWAETQPILAQRLPAILSTLIVQLRGARRQVSTREMSRQVSRLQKLRRRAWRHPNILAFRVELVILWWQIHWLTIVATLFGIVGLIFILIILIILALNLPDWINQLRN